MYHPKFDALRVLLRRIPYIDFGGCGIAALAMYQIGKEVNMNVQLMYLYDYDGEDDYESNMHAIHGLAPIQSVMHAVCVVDNEALDAKCKVPVNAYPFKHFVTEDFVIRSLRKQDIWNPMFDRNSWLPRIEIFLGYKLPI